MEQSNNTQQTNKPNELNDALNGFLNTENKDPNMDCSSGVCVLKGDKSILERINKKIITEDGRQLLF
jgi:hypothetical protein